MPSTGKGGNSKSSGETEMMPSIHKVCKYLNLNYFEALSLPCDVFALALKNAVIDKLRESEEGRKYLSDCERLSTTTMDLDSLTETFGKE